MAVNTIVIDVPMLNAAPPLRVSVIVSRPPSNRIGAWPGILATTVALELTSAARTNTATASSKATRRDRAGESVSPFSDVPGAGRTLRTGSPVHDEKAYLCFSYAGPVPGFEPLPAQVDLPALEQEVLTRWQDAALFERSLKQTAGGPRWTFYEGPPTANGMPGAHHVEARTFKDLFPRFKTMQGFHVPRKAGWDCHGLPVEVAVEKELGLTGKRDIEAYGVAAFNARCRESVLRHVDAWLEMSRRMGYWADTGNAYRTMDASYVESVWWSLKNIYEQGLLVRDHRISPYCPRCGTPLSDHEMGQPDVYQEVTDPSVTVRFPLTKVPAGASRHLQGADLLVWTTTPWTLVSNTAVAVHPEVEYVIARRSGGFQGGIPAGKHRGDADKVVVAEALYGRVLGEGWHVLATVRGADLLGAGYQRPFNLIDIPDSHRVVSGTFVTTEDG